MKKALLVCAYFVLCGIITNVRAMDEPKASVAFFAPGLAPNGPPGYVCIFDIQTSTTPPSTCTPVSAGAYFAGTAMAYDALGNLYYEEAQKSPFKLVLKKRVAHTNKVQDFFTVVGSTGALPSPYSFSLAYDGNHNVLAYETPALSVGSATVPGRVCLLKLNVTQPATASCVSAPTGVYIAAASMAFDDKGNLYYSEIIKSPFTVNLKMLPYGSSQPISVMNILPPAQSGLGPDSTAIGMAYDAIHSTLTYSVPGVGASSRQICAYNLVTRAKPICQPLPSTSYVTAASLVYDASGDLYYDEVIKSPFQLNLTLKPAYIKKPQSDSSVVISPPLSTTLEAASNANQFPNVSYPSSGMAYDPGERIYFDWASSTPGCYESAPPGAAPAYHYEPVCRSGVSGVTSYTLGAAQLPSGYQDRLLANAKQVLWKDSGLVLPLLDSRVFPQIKTSPPSDAIHVRFAKALPPACGNCGLLLGEAYTGVNTCLKHGRHDPVIVFAFNTPRDATVAVHEAGHGVGLIHVYEPLSTTLDTFTGIPLNSTSIMDYVWLAPDQERFHPTPMNHDEHPYGAGTGPNGTQSSLFAFRSLALNQPTDFLQNILSLEPGTLDSCSNVGKTFGLTFHASAALSISDFIVSNADTLDPLDNVEPSEHLLASSGLTTSSIDQVDVRWNGSGYLRARAASQPGGVRDLVFMFDGTSGSSDALSNPTDGVLSGSVMQIVPGQSTPQQVGTFTLETKSILNADLLLTGSGNRAIVPPGGQVVYTVDMQNIGTDVAQQSLLSFQVISAGAQITDASDSDSCTINGASATCNIDQLAPNETRRFEFTVIAPPTGPLVSSASVQMSAQEYRLDNNTIQFETIVSTPLAADVDFNGVVDMNDVLEITNRLGMPAYGPDDPADIDGDGTITVLDARRAVLLCSKPRCATQ